MLCYIVLYSIRPCYIVLGVIMSRTPSKTKASVRQQLLSQLGLSAATTVEEPLASAVTLYNITL